MVAIATDGEFFALTKGLKQKADGTRTAPTSLLDLHHPACGSANTTVQECIDAVGGSKALACPSLWLALRQALASVPLGGTSAYPSRLGIPDASNVIKVYGSNESNTRKPILPASGPLFVVGAAAAAEAGPEAPGTLLPPGWSSTPPGKCNGCDKCKPPVGPVKARVHCRSVGGWLPQSLITGRKE